MKSLNVPVLLILLVLLTSETANELVNKTLKGNIKSITESCFTAQWQQLNGHDSLVENGLDHTYYYRFDTRGNLIEENSLFGNIKCFYNGIGQRKREEVLLDNKWFQSAVHYYTQPGKLLIDTTFDQDGRITSICQYKYDEKGHNTEQRFIGVEGVPLPPYSGTSYKYDGSNYYTEMIIHDQANAIVSRTTFKYNAQGFKTEMTDFTHADSLSKRSIYTLDSMNNVIELKCYDAKGNSLHDWDFTCKYIYDKAGNWIKSVRTDYYGVYVCKREIAYY